MLFYELMQAAIGQREKLSRNPSDKDWAKLFAISQKQAVVGVAFLALDKLSKDGQKPPKEILYGWIGQNERIRRQNDVTDKRCAEITRHFSDAGFRSCILKGQGNARMYPVPGSRTPGDIDIWVYGRTDTNSTHGKDIQLREDITRLVKQRCPEVFEQYHHIEFPIFDDVPVEVHYTPGQLLSPKYNKRFQNYCRDFCLRPDGLVAHDGFEAPSVEFNAVYQMAHIMIHFFIEGIGLRHFVDYYYVLTNVCLTNRTDVRDTLRYLGMEKFAKGVMWVEQHCFGLADEFLLFKPSEKTGRLILKEMECGGNFGHHDERYTFRRHGLLARGIADTARLLRLATLFPSESFWKIAKKIDNQKWKLAHLII